MNRRQRRASGRQKDGPELFRRAARRLIKGTTLSGTRPTGRYLVMKIRPMTVADMVPGHAYRPGLTLLEVQMPPTATQVGVEWQFPVMVPEGLREPTSDNARAVYAYVYGTDPEARRIIDELKILARPWSEVLAAQGLPIEKLGPIVSASPGATS